MSQKTLPSCLFPTTIVIVDDDQMFLESLSYALKLKGITATTFTNPNEALKFVNQQTTLDVTKCYSTSVDITEDHSVYESKADLSGIMKYALNRERGTQLSMRCPPWKAKGRGG